MHRNFSRSIALPLLAALMLYCGNALVAQPQFVNSFEFDEELHDIVFRNANEGYALGSQFVWHTSDAGVTWTRSMFLAFRPDFTAIALFGENGIIIGDAMGGIHAAVHPDSAWISSLPGDNHLILEIEAVDRNHWVAITDAAILSTIDGGTTYQTFKPENNIPLSALDITNESLMHVSSAVSTIWRSTDGGATWKQLQGSQFGELYDVRFTSADTGFVASWYPWNLYTTTDGGMTWSAGPFEYPTSIAIHPNGFGAYATNQYVRVSDDGGMTWSDSLGFSEIFSNEIIYGGQKVVTAGPNSIFLLLSYRDVVVESDPGHSVIARVDRLSDVPVDRPRRFPATLNLSSRE